MYSIKYCTSLIEDENEAKYKTLAMQCPLSLTWDN